MKVFKFGGASIKDADTVKNLVEIVKKSIGYELVIVVSAMGKMTNALEKLCTEYFYRDGDISVLIEPIRRFHLDICEELFSHAEDSDTFKDVERTLDEVKSKCLELKRAGASYDFLYDQVVSYGEILSSTIVSDYLTNRGIHTVWLDATNLIRTDNQYREGRINWEKTEELIKEHILFMNTSVYLTQGFIASSEDGHTTTLGREGSDFTAAIIGNVMDAKEVIIWKDVPGLLNADPKFFSNTRKLNNISYHEAIELAYYGATIIHPKTIKPLQNKGIPLFVKSFKESTASGSTINENSSEDSLIPSYIFRTNQVLYSIFTRDYSFVDEKVLSELFSTFDRHHIKINLMENSAIGFTTCFDHDEEKLKALTNELNKKYKVLYNTGVELMTVRHYDQATIDQLVLDKEVLVEQKSRHTARMVIQSKSEGHN